MCVCVCVCVCRHEVASFRGEQCDAFIEICPKGTLKQICLIVFSALFAYVTTYLGKEEAAAMVINQGALLVVS